MAEPMLVAALNTIIDVGTEGERQLALMLKDLIQLTGDQEKVMKYISQEAARVLDEEPRCQSTLTTSRRRSHPTSDGPMAHR
jgi:hypothetical protein